jgi:hypothetical protein
MVDKAADILPAPGEVEHHVNDALAGAVIGIAPAAAGAKHRQSAGIEQLLGAGAGAACVKRRMLEQPDKFGGVTGADRRDAALHRGHRLGVGNRRWAAPPFDRGGGIEACIVGHVA